MWITTVTYDSVGLRALDPAVVEEIQSSIADKKNTLKSIDQAGDSLPGFEAPALDEIDPTASAIVVKRGWNTESAAREFASFADAASEFITATVEEQV